MVWPQLTAAALLLGWILSPDVLVRLGSGVAANRTLFLAAVALAALLTALGGALIRHPALRDRNGRCSQTGLLLQGIGRLPALSLLFASRLTMVLLLPCGLLVAAGSTFNETFLFWFPNFGFAFLLLSLITLLHLAGERFAAAAQPLFAGVALVCLLLLCLAGLGGPGSGKPVSMDIGFAFTPGVLAGALLLFLGTDSPPPGRTRDSRLPPFAALLTTLLLFLLWGMLSLQYVPAEQLAASTVPHLLVAREILGEPGRMLMASAVISGAAAAINTFFYLAATTFAGLAERNLLPGHPPGRLLRRRYVLLFALIIAALLAAGIAGHDILETYIQATLLLWLLLFAMLLLAAGRLLRRQNISASRQGFVLAAVFGFVSLYLAADHQEAAVIFRFILLTLAASAGICFLWLRKQPACEVIHPQSETKGGPP